MRKCKVCGTEIERRNALYCSPMCLTKKPPIEDLTGMVFGEYVVKGYYGWHDYREYWNCQCKCDKKTINKVAKRHLVSGRAKSCGCLAIENANKARFQDLTGETFGYLTVIKRTEMPKHWSKKGTAYNKSRHRTAYLCRCNHGGEGEPTEVIVEAAKLKSGRTSSCGCLVTRRGPDNPTWNSREVICIWCGNVFYRQPWHIEKNKYNFCTKDCASKYLVGENAAGWLGGMSFEPYPVGWNSACREHIRKRDNYKCVVCGKTKEENGYNLSVHHVDYNKKNLDAENLVTLCRGCHNKTNTNRDYWQEYFKREKKQCESFHQMVLV